MERDPGRPKMTKWIIRTRLKSWSSGFWHRDTEDGGSTAIQNTGILSYHCTASQYRSQGLQYSSFWTPQTSQILQSI